MTTQKDRELVAELTEYIIQLISETNGVSLNHTLELLSLILPFVKTQFF